MNGWARRKATSARSNASRERGKTPITTPSAFTPNNSAEKYLKARLCEAGIGVAKIHDLVALMEQVLTVEPSWESFREDLAFLTDFSVSFRYPGESADKASAMDARRRCRSFRRAARKSLSLKL